MKRYVKFAFENSIFLIAGALIGLVWANIGPSSYAAFRDVQVIPPSWISFFGGSSGHGVGLHYLVNDVLMAFFFALAGKEVWSAMLPGGALRGISRAAVPVICAVGGMAGPAVVYLLGAAFIGQIAAVGRGWAIPCATDIAFSYIVALIVFGKGHPAVPFLLLLAIADDALGLVVLAAFYPQKAMQPLWLLLALGAVVLGLVLRRRRVRSFWWYLLLPGGLSWTGLALAGLHPALGLLPIIPILPHFRLREDHVHWGIAEGDWALDRLESWWKNPVEIILGVFGLMNAGVPLTACGSATYLVFLGLLLGKPAGIFLGGLLARTLLRLPLPHGISWRTLLVIGCAAGIGFTVALFVATVAFEPEPLQDAAKMGALASVLAATVAIVAAKLLGVEKDITVYVDGSRIGQTLSTVGQGKSPQATEAGPRSRRRVTHGSTSKFRMGCGTLFVTVNRDDKGLCEVFANLGKTGGSPSQSEATCRAVSAALRCGVDPAILTEQLRSIRCPTTCIARKANNGVNVLSCPDAIARALEESCGTKLTGGTTAPPVGLCAERR